MDLKGENRMNEKRVQEFLDEIKHYADKKDDEKAHSKEDALYNNLIFSISEGICEDPQACCKLALTSGYIDFCRWCA